VSVSIAGSALGKCAETLTKKLLIQTRYQNTGQSFA